MPPSAPPPTVEPLLPFSVVAHYDWLNVPVWVYDVERARIVWANGAALGFWRAASLDELLARSYDDTSATSVQRLRAAMASHAEGRVTRSQWTLYPAGVPITAVLVGRGIALEDGRAAVLFAGEPLAASYDAAALRGVEAMQHTSVRVALHRGRDGAALMRNPAASAAFGPVDGEQPPDALAATFVDAAIARHIVRRVAKGQTFSGEAELLTTGGRRWHAIDARPVRDPVTGDTVVQVNARDISELKASQRALEAARDTAEQANHAKSAFLANMSHEIRTPMNGVLGLTQLVLDTELTAKQRQFLELAQGSAQSLMHLINDILDLSKVEAGKLLLDPAPFGLRALLDETLAAPQHQAQAKGLEFAWHVAHDVPERLFGDAPRLRQILQNLVGNALKFTTKGRVDVRVTRAGAMADDGTAALRFEIDDTGIGMAPEQLARIFDAFTQADDSITRRYGGTGLGLSIAQRLARLMGGRIEARSTPGVGSRFSVELALPRVG